MIPRAPKVSQRAPKVSQKEAKGNEKAAKGSQKGTKGEPRGNQNETKDDQNVSKNRPSKNVAKSIDSQILFGPFWKPCSIKNKLKFHAKIKQTKLMKFDEKSMGE